MADEYRNPNMRSVDPFKNRAFKKYFGISMVAVFVVLIFFLFIWLAGGRQRGIPDEIDFIQLEEPKAGDPIVVFETNLGTMKAMLFPNETPEYYHYFKNLVDSGYYDGTYVCAVVEDAYALGGTKFSDPNREYGEESDTTQIKAEVSDNIWPLKGSICSFIGESWGKTYAGSSMIFINDLTAVNEAYMDEEALKRAYGEELGGVFAEKGGIPNFSGKYTIFAQIYEGLDVMEAICGAETLETSQPASDIILEKVYISSYEG